MKTIQLEVKDNYVDNVMTLLSGLKDIMIDKIEIQKDKNLELDPYFYERKAELEQLDRDIESGKEELFDFNESMDLLIKELES